MAKLFILDPTGKSLFDGLGLEREKANNCYRVLAEKIEEDLLEFAEIDDGKINFTHRTPELMQHVAEFVDMELTPELGFAIGLIIADVDSITGGVINKLQMEGKL